MVFLWVFLWFTRGYFPSLDFASVSAAETPPFKATLGDMKALWREVARLQQAERSFTGCEESRIIVLKLWKYMEIYLERIGTIWIYMEIYGNIWKYMEIYGNIYGNNRYGSL